MNFLNSGAFKRHTNLPRKHLAANTSMDRTMTSSAMLPTLELRRLVAAMVD